MELMESLGWALRIIITVLCLWIMVQQRRLAKNQEKLLENDKRILGDRSIRF